MKSNKKSKSMPSDRLNPETGYPYEGNEALQEHLNKLVKEISDKLYDGKLEEIVKNFSYYHK